jgi:hypothetical protein
MPDSVKIRGPDEAWGEPIIVDGAHPVSILQIPPHLSFFSYTAATREDLSGYCGQLLKLATLAVDCRPPTHNQISDLI